MFEMLRRPRGARLARRVAIAACLAAGLPCAPGRVAGQDPPAGGRDLRVTVTQIAGSTVYVDAGTGAGVLTGDTVEVRRAPAETPAGMLVVISAASRSAVLTFADRTFPITRGERLYLRSPSIAGAAAPAAAPAGPTPAARHETPERRGPRARGRIGLDVDVIDSRTEYGQGADQAVERRYATPVLRFDTRVSDLPGGLNLEVSGRGSYRYSSLETIEQPTSFRLYSASIEKRFSTVPVYIRAGRFYNRYESYSGYWDGALVRLGGRSAGIGAVAGFQPYRWNQKFSTDLPKLSIFADFSAGTGRTSYAMDVSAHRVEPRDGLPDHTFFGLSQILRHDGFRLSQDLQVDRDPETDEWELTRLYLNASVRAGEQVDIRGSVARRRTYRLWDSVSVIDYARDRASLGMTVHSGGTSFGGDVALIRAEDDQAGPSVGAYLQVPGPGPVGVTASASYWKGDDYEVLSLAPGLSATWGRFRLDGGYRYYRSDYAVRDLLRHAVQGALSVGLDGRVRLGLRGVGQWGDGLRSIRLYSGISKSF